MATPAKLTHCSRSAYQAHLSTFTDEGESSNVIDLTERKLRRIADKHPEEEVRKLAARMCHDYTRGLIAIAWERGNVPVYSFLRL